MYRFVNAVDGRDILLKILLAAGRNGASRLFKGGPGRPELFMTGGVLMVKSLPVKD
jgi:hypothetical protein